VVGAVAPAERRIVVWIHGAEIQSPGRRRFNYRDEVALQAAVESTRQRDAFWRALFQDRREGLRFVFVSRTFAEEVWTDLGVRCADGRWCVIHNPIDTGLFQGPPKDPAQRLKVLSVRPHDAPIYANDLVGQAIELMSADEDFASLSFELVGDGALWEENFGGLDRHANVSLRREFLRQGEVAGLHRNHGVFLVPTRGDTQGVSRDEAMSSGLVPVTCRVGSVAEFVDDDSGILCPPEDPRALADAVLSLAKDPVLFSRLSGGASARVRRQSGVDVVLPQELRMLGERVRGD
jgi:glycosyltransferase involved in cell wall biosynthesis